MNKTRPQHAPMNQFPIENGSLKPGGIPIEQLAQRVGSTPFYAYDRQFISNRISELKQQLPQQVRLHYAIKANPMPALVQFMAKQVDGFDLASQGEMQIALDSSMPADRISFAGPGKRQEELNAAVAAGVTINIESEAELQRVLVAANFTGCRPRVAIRVNPDFELKASGMKMSGGPKQFGIDAELVPDVLRNMASMDIDFMGFHIFSGSQNLNQDSLIEAQQKSIELAINLSQHTNTPLQKLNIGGGFGIPYFPGEQRLDVKPIGEALAQQIPLLQEKLGQQLALIIELGRYLVGEAGLYVTRVIERKMSRGEVFLITDGGMHHHLAASGNFGQVIRKNYPVAIGNKMNADETEMVNAVGPLCTPLDILANKMELPVAEPGDLLVVFQSGAYGLTASPIHFLSHPVPQEILI